VNGNNTHSTRLCPDCAVLPALVLLLTPRDRVQPLLRSLCCGVTELELMPAVSGLLSGSAAVRATALTALPHVPTLAEGVAPEAQGVVAVLALARHDVNEDNAAAADALWEQVKTGCGCGGGVLLSLCQPAMSVVVMSCSLIVTLM